MKVFVTGATGLIGRRLVRRIVERGDEVILLTRDRKNVESWWLENTKVQVMKGSPCYFEGAWRENFAGCHAVVNLAGEPIFGRRWTDELKGAILETRVTATKNVAAAIGHAPPAERPTVLVNASAIGYYGLDAGEKPLEEGAPSGADFLAKVCAQWEDAARGATAHGARVVVLRIGVVLDPAGGALGQMLTPFRMFVGGPIGGGQQWFSWIHAEDLVGLILFAIDQPALRGPVNAVAPEPVRMKEFARELGAVLHRPSWFPVPRFVLRARFGEVADVIAGSQRVAPKAALAAGYPFRFPKAREALEDLLKARAGAAAKA